MAADHPKQRRIIASSGGKLRAEEEELMLSREQCGCQSDRNVAGRELEESAKSDGEEHVN